MPSIVPARLRPQGWFRLFLATPATGVPPPTLRSVGAAALEGRRILETSNRAGTYGMGGPGFLALRLTGTRERSKGWLVLCLWAADHWCHFDGLPLEARPGQAPEVYGYSRFHRAVRGQSVQGVDIGDDSCRLAIGPHVLEIREAPSERPAHAGDGSPRALEPGESLLDAWVLSPTTELFV